MSDDVTARLDAIEAYCAAAPVGPYTYGDIESVAGGSLYDPAVMIASVHWDNEPTPIHRFRHPDQADALGHFIAQARTDLPAVVAALRDALAEVEGQTLVARQYERERDAARGEASAMGSLVEGVRELLVHERAEHLAAAERAQAEIERLRGIVVRDDGMVLACDFHLVLVASDGEGEAREACPACEAQSARSRLGDATAQIRRMGDDVATQKYLLRESQTERDALAAEVARWETRYPCDSYCTAEPYDGPHEDCSRHGRTPSDLWGMLARLNAPHDAPSGDPITDDDPELPYGGGWGA